MIQNANGFEAITLESGGDKPTASCFVDPNCQGPYQSVGVYSGHRTGCTALEQRSYCCYLYSGC
jgi:hypothetical protein